LSKIKVGAGEGVANGEGVGFILGRRLASRACLRSDITMRESVLNSKEEGGRAASTEIKGKSENSRLSMATLKKRGKGKADHRENERIQKPDTDIQIESKEEGPQKSSA